MLGAHDEPAQADGVPVCPSEAGLAQQPAGRDGQTCRHA